MVKWGVASFEEVEKVFQRIGHISLSDSSTWRRKEVWGSQKRLGVSMDGTMVHIVDEGWKELKVGCVFDIDVSTTWDEEAQEWEELAHGVSNQYVSHLGGLELFGQLLWAEAQQRGREWAQDKEVVGDRASWVWKTTRTHFFDARQAVDFVVYIQLAGRVSSE
jgi:hypothetical protein